MSDIPVWYVSNRNPSITEQITAAGVAVDLTSSTVRFKMRAVNSATLKVDAAATIVAPATAGNVRYDWAAADVDTAGLYLVWWEVTTGTKTQDVGEALVEFRAHAPVAAELCTLADVRAAMETKAADVALDPLTTLYIGAASELIMQECEQEFAPVTTAATRDFPVYGSRTVSLAPYSLRSATSVTLITAGASSVLTAGTTYELGRLSKWGTYNDLLLSRYYTVAGLSAEAAFGTAIARVAGAWGFATVPRLAKEACVLTVRAWLRRSYADGYNLGDTTPGLQPRAGLDGYALPLAAKSMLRTMHRNPLGIF